MVGRNDEQLDTFAKCITDIVGENTSMNDGLIVSIEDDNARHPVFAKLMYRLNSLQMPVYIHTSTKRRPAVVHLVRIHYFAIVLVDNVAISDTVSSLVAQIKALKSSPITWNPRGKLIIALQNKVQRPTMKIRRQIVAAAWRMRVINFVVMFMPVRLEYFKIYSAKPFSGVNCASVPNPSLVDICDNRSLVYHTEDHYFQQKFYRHFPACTLSVFTPREVPPYVLANPNKNSPALYSDGVEVKMLNLIAEFTKFSLTWVQENQLSSDSKNTYSSFWADTNGGELACKEVDVAFGSLRPTVERATICDMTHPYFAFTVSWFVPKAVRDHSWAVHILGTGLWLCLIGGYLVASCFIMLIFQRHGITGREVVAGNGSGQNTLDSILSVLKFTVSFVWKNFPVKFLFFCWVIFQVRVQTSLTSSIVSVLTRPGYGHQIDTIRDLLDSNLSICIADESESCREIFADDDIVEMYRRSVVCPNMTGAVERMITDRNISVLGIEDYLLSLSKQVRTNTHVIQEKLAFFGLGMFLKRDSFYLEAFNLAIRRAMVAGLPGKWLSDARQRESSIARDSDDVFVTLKMNNIRSVFRILVTGWIIALAVFCCELWIKHNPLGQLYGRSV